MMITAEQIRELLPMRECIDVMATAMMAVSSGRVSIPPRLYFSPLSDSKNKFGLMPGGAEDLSVYGAKILSEHPDNPAQGLPSIQGFVVLFDRDTGVPVAMIDGATLTEIRTAAASGLATRMLARANARSCGIFGTGVQAVAHIDAMCAVRPVEEIKVWGRSYERAKAFANEQAIRTGLDVRATDNPEEAGGCDLICTVTGSAVPVLKGDWVKPGTHINLVGASYRNAREADTNLVIKSSIYVDLIESYLNEAGDILIPMQEGAIGEDFVIGEVGSLIAGNIPGRRDDSQITLYKSLGMVAQDLFAGQYVLSKMQIERSA